MRIFGKTISSRLLFQILFHIVLWSAWVAYPFVAGPDDEKFRMYATAIIPVTLSHIPFFLINSNWLIPRIFKRKGIALYLVSLFFLILIATLAQTALKELVVPNDLMRRHWHFSWMLLGTLFVTGVSTGYGFVFYLLHREQVILEAQEEQLKSELSFLRSQISPHFIFNVLNSLIYLIRNKPIQAESITLKLSELIRYMLYESSDKLVPLEKELDYLNNYVELQRIRFGEDVNIKMNLATQDAAYQIEPMLIIPFVENAFKHGIGMIEEPIIDISIQAIDGYLNLMVKNKLAQDTNEEKDPSSGIGLKNVKRRLELLYPGKHQLDLHMKENWFEAILKLEISH